jgi:hypothetical protein
MKKKTKAAKFDAIQIASALEQEGKFIAALDWLRQDNEGANPHR